MPIAGDKLQAQVRGERDESESAPGNGRELEQSHRLFVPGECAPRVQRRARGDDDGGEGQVQSESEAAGASAGALAEIRRANLRIRKSSFAAPDRVTSPLSIT